MNELKIFLNSLIPLFYPIDFEKSICLPCLVNKIRQSTNVFNRLKIGIFLFSYTWIDQVLFYILMDSKNLNCFNEEDFYKKFKHEFPFPKLCEHGTWNAIRPTRILTEFGIEFHPKSHALKHEILCSFLETWTSVSEWLIQHRRADLIFEAKQEFQKDLIMGERIPGELGYSFNRYLNHSLT